MVGIGRSGAVGQCVGRCDRRRVQKQPLNIAAVVMFLILRWAQRCLSPSGQPSRVSLPKNFYTAGGGISGFQNGLAIAGDASCSAASFWAFRPWGLCAATTSLIYSTGFLVGWPIVLSWWPSGCATSGNSTFTDVVAHRLKQTPVRVFAASGSLFWW